MELKDIKKSFFGFNKNSVMEYIAELNHICAETTESLRNEKSELSQTNEKLNSRISALETEIDVLKEQLLESKNKIEHLNHENAVLRLENQKMYDAENQKLQKYRENIKNVKTVIDTILRDSKQNLNRKKKS